MWRLLGHATECRTGDFEAGAALVRRSVELLETAEPGRGLTGREIVQILHVRRS